MGVALPNAYELSRLFTDLLGRDVKVSAATGPPSPAAIAIYRTDDDQPMCACVADLDAAARVGAALTMVPADVATDAVKAGALGSTLTDNAYEVFNILAQVFNQAGSSHVRLSVVGGSSPGDLPDDASTVVATPESRANFAISIAGYGDGIIALLAAANT